MTRTSKSLLERAKHTADRSAWSELSSVYEPLIRKWLSRFAAPPSDQDDLTQEILLVVMRRLPEFQHNDRPGAFRAWLRNITSFCLKDLRKRKRLPTQTHEENGSHDRLAQLADPSSELSRIWNAEHDQFVAAAIMRRIRVDFDEHTWQAFERVALLGQAASEVAQHLNMKRDAVYAAKSRVMARLRQEAQGILNPA